MKRSNKRLTLSRETLLNLDLRAAHGRAEAPTRTEIQPCFSMSFGCGCVTAGTCMSTCTNCFGCPGTEFSIAVPTCGC